MEEEKNRTDMNAKKKLAELKEFPNQQTGVHLWYPSWEWTTKLLFVQTSNASIKMENENVILYRTHKPFISVRDFLFHHNKLQPVGPKLN